MTGADDNAGIAALFTIGCLLAAGFLICGVCEIANSLHRFHQRGLARLRRKGMR